MGCIAERDKEFANAVTRGSEWTVLKHEVRARWPAVLPLIIEARNVQGHIQRKTPEVQCRLKMQSMAANYQSAGKTIDWLKIKRAALRGRPPYAAIVDSILAFASSHGGGVSGQFMKDYASFYSAFVRSSAKELPAEVYDAASAMNNTMVAIACLKAAYACPQRFVDTKGV